MLIELLAFRLLLELPESEVTVQVVPFVLSVKLSLTLPLPVSNKLPLPEFVGAATAKMATPLFSALNPELICRNCEPLNLTAGSPFIALLARVGAVLELAVTEYALFDWSVQELSCAGDPVVDVLTPLSALSQSNGFGNWGSQLK